VPKERLSSSSPLNYTAENIGTACGQLAKRFEELTRRHAELGAELQRVTQAAPWTLAGIGAEAGELAASVTGKRKGGRPEGYKVSAATRAKLKAAWKRRHKEQKASGDSKTA
jgi:hypothetical protein